MFIQIAPKVRVYVSDHQMMFVKKYAHKAYFTDKDLDADEVHVAKILADKSVYVRKKLDNNVQYALNKQVVRINREFKKTPGTGKTD